MKVFKVPKIGKSGVAQKSSSKVIGVIDASGSMSNVWSWLATFWNECIPKDDTITITFDTTSKVAPNNQLESSINKHGGGGTNITQAFDEFERHLDKLPKGTEITAIFISDGDDNHRNTLDARFNKLKGNPGHNINFICLGVGSGFPTNISMRLREKYHNGQNELPALFLIEYPSEKAFFNKFESMKQYFQHNALLNIHPAVCIYPWNEYQTKVYENQWILTDSKEVDIEGKVFDLSKKGLELDGVTELFRGWLQAIHLESLKGDIKDTAKKTIKFMEDIVEMIKKERGIDILKIKDLDPNEDGLTFGERALRNHLKYTVARVEWFYDEIKLLAEGKTPKELSEFEAAKRIGLGTITGKYHQKALALKGITIEDFQKLRDEFEEIYKKTKLTPNSSQEASVFSLLNQKEVFLQKDFLDGLRLCSSQFDLVGAFAMVGLAIKIKRYNGSMVNPWLTEVRFIAKHHKAIDSIAILKNNNSLELKTGDNTVEQINAILPLFSKEDADLKPLITSKIYHLLMTFNVIQNVDTLYDTAYLALLSNTLIYLLQEKDSQWKDDLLQLIDSTTRITYYEDPEFIKFRKALLDDPADAIANDEEQKKYGSIDLSKAILHLFLLHKDKEADEFATKQIIEAILLRFLVKVHKAGTAKMGDFLKVKAVSKSIEGVVKAVRENFPKFVTMGDCRRCVYDMMEKMLTNVELYEHEWDFTELYKVDEKVTLGMIETLYTIFLGAKPTQEDYIRYATRVYIANTYEDLFTPASKNTDPAAVTGMMAKKIIDETQKGGIKKLPQCRDAVAQMEKEFAEWFRPIHKHIIPISVAELKKHCQENKLDFNKYQILDGSNLLRNACLAPGCPHYLKLNNSLGHHNAVWSEKLPYGFHKTVKQYYKDSPEVIYEKFTEGALLKGTEKGKWHFEYDKYDVNKEFVMDYIKRLQDTYKKILETP